MPAALYRATPQAEWVDVEIIDWKHRQYVVREVGKPLPGVFLATFDQLRIPGGVIEQPEIEPRNYLPKTMTPAQRYLYRQVREVCGRDQALRIVLELP
jgi:hypothetical protein